MEVKVVNGNNERIDKYLSNNTDLSRTLISKMIEDEYILVNNKKTKNNYKVKEEDMGMCLGTIEELENKDNK